MHPLTQPLPLLLRGTLIIDRRRCGNPRCRCARGALHETPALSSTVAGQRTKLMLRSQDLPLVRAALARYRRARAKLDRQVLRDLARLRARIAREKAARRKRRS